MPKKAKYPKPTKRFAGGAWVVLWRFSPTPGEYRQYTVSTGLTEKKDDELAADIVLRTFAVALAQDRPNFPVEYAGTSGVRRYMADRLGLDASGKWLVDYEPVIRQEVVKTWASPSLSMLRRLEAFTGGRLEYTTPDQAQGFLTKLLADGLKPARRNRALIMCNRFFKWAIRTKRTQENPFAGIKLLKEARSEEIVYCTKAERDRLIGYARATGEADWLAVPVAFYAGMRREELYRMKWEDIEGNRGEDGRDALYCSVSRNLPDIARQLIQAGVSTDVTLYCKDADSLPVYATSREMADALYEQNRRNVYFGTGFNLGGIALVDAITQAIDALPEEVHPLVIVAQFDFIHSLLKQIHIKVTSNPDDFPSAAVKREGPIIETGIGVEEVEKAFAELLQAREKVAAAALRDGTVSVREERPLTEILKELDSAMCSLEQRTALIFAKGLTRRKINSLWKSAASPLPENLATLYAWRNGTGPDAGEFFHRYRFLSMESALESYREMRPLYSSAFFPFMQDVFGCRVQYDMRPDQHGGLVYESDVDAFDQPIVYPGLNAYFAALAACFREGVFRVIRDADAGSDVLVGYGDHMDAVFRSYALRLPGDEAMEKHEADDETEAGEVGESMHDYRIPLH